MADPTRQRIVSVKVRNANIGEYVKVNNLTSGGQFYGRVQGTDRSVIIQDDDNFTWANGDIIQAELHGRLNGMARGTIQAGGASLNIEATADTTTPGGDL